MKIITEGMVREAIRLAEPTALAILETPGCFWGPQWVRGLVRAGLGADIPFTFGTVAAQWNPEWGSNRGFEEIAQAKLEVTDRTGLPTSVVVALYSHLLEEGEFLYPGGACRDENACGVSGAKGRADEAIAELVLGMLNMLIQLETDRRKAAGENQI